jgi:hypothetical protein
MTERLAHMLLMRWFCALSFCVLAAAPAAGGQASVCSEELIPADKRAAPTVEYNVVFLDQNQVRHMCGYEWAASRDYLWGCASDEGDGLWNIYVEKRLDEMNRACVILHEKAHLPPNLWVHQNTFRLSPGSYFRRPIHWQTWNAWLATLPAVKPITYN